MEVVLTLLLCALGFFLYLADKNNSEILDLKEKLREKESTSEKVLLQSSAPPKKFVSVVFKEGETKFYDYFVGDNYDLQVNDLVEVPVNSRFDGKTVKIAIVKYVSKLGEKSERAWATVLRKADYNPRPVYNPQPVREIIHELVVEKPVVREIVHEVVVEKPILMPILTPTNLPPKKMLPKEKRFAQVIFKKYSKKRYDYFLGENNDVKVGDFVVVHVNISGKTTWKIAKVVYVSSHGEVSTHAKSAIIKKADYPKW